MRDKLRENVKNIVYNCRERGNINVRMISGDHIETARQVAIDAGILTEADQSNKDSVMDASAFREIVGQNLVSTRDEITGQINYELEN
jgi:Ca2+-transporting ATPase